MSTKPEMVEFEGHLIFPGATHLSPNEGTYAFTMTLSYIPSYGVSANSTRTGLVVPRPGSSLGEVKAAVFMWMRRMVGGQDGGHVVMFWSFEPNVVFGITGYGGNPPELTPAKLAEEVKAYTDETAPKQS